MEQALIAFILLILLLAAGYFIYSLYRKSRRRVVTLAASLGLEDIKSGVTYEAEANGQKYFYKYFSGSKNNPSYFKVWIDCQSRGSFRVGKETGFDRFFKNLGIAVEIQTGDNQFDKDYYINTDTVAFTRACFSSPERRQVVNELFNLNFREIQHDGKHMEAKISPFKFNESFDKSSIESAVKHLVAFSRELPEDYYEPRVVGTPAWKFKRGLIYAVSITSLAAGAGFLIWGNISFPPLDKLDILKESLEQSIPAVILFIVASIMLLKGRSSSHKDFLFTLGFALVGFPMTGYSGTIVVNGFFDRAPVSRHETMVIGKRYTTSKNSHTYFLKLRSWRENRAHEELTVTKRVYDKAAAGDTIMKVTTRPGYLGYEWVAGYALKEDRD